MFLYGTNETMKMLGKQYPIGLLGKGGIAAEDFGNVLDAHKKNGTQSLFDFGVDAFMLGFIYGKRLERKRKTNGNYNQRNESGNTSNH